MHFLLIDAIEIDEVAFEQARENFANAPWCQLTCHLANVQSFKPIQPYQTIVCNPPFFKAHMMDIRQVRTKPFIMKRFPLKTAMHINRLLSSNGQAWVMYPAHEMKLFQDIMQKQGLFTQSFTQQLRW